MHTCESYLLTRDSTHCAHKFFAKKKKRTYFQTNHQQKLKAKAKANIPTLRIFVEGRECDARLVGNAHRLDRRCGQRVDAPCLSANDAASSAPSRHSQGDALHTECLLLACSHAGARPQLVQNRVAFHMHLRWRARDRFTSADQSFLHVYYSTAPAGEKGRASQ